MAAKTPKSKIFNWTDEETALLLKVVADFKSEKISAGQDWETIRSKYEDLRVRYLEAYPVEEGSEEFPNSSSKETFTKERLTAKIKKIRNSFRNAIDSVIHVLYCFIQTEPSL